MTKPRQAVQPDQPEEGNMTITDPRPEQLSELLTTKQVAERLHMSQAWVRLKIGTGELPVVRLGRRTLFDTRDVQALIERSKGE